MGDSALQAFYSIKNDNDWDQFKASTEKDDFFQNKEPGHHSLMDALMLRSPYLTVSLPAIGLVVWRDALMAWSSQKPPESIERQVDDFKLQLNAMEKVPFE